MVIRYLQNEKRDQPHLPPTEVEDVRIVVISFRNIAKKRIERWNKISISLWLSSLLKSVLCVNIKPLPQNTGSNNINQRGQICPNNMLEVSPLNPVGKWWEGCSWALKINFLHSIAVIRCFFEKIYQIKNVQHQILYKKKVVLIFLIWTTTHLVRNVGNDFFS